jgi:hypothetical protein
MAIFTKYFEYFALSRGTNIYFNYPPASGLYGGVKIGMDWDSFEESPLKYADTFNTDPFEPINGSFNFTIKGPTSSGIAYFVRLIQDYAISAKDFYNERSLYPVKLFTFQSFYSPTATLLDAEVEFDKEELVDTLLIVRGKFSYTRKAIILDKYDAEFPVGTAKPFTTQILQTLPNRTPEPTDLSVSFGNASEYMPSGYLLLSNLPFVTLSGHLFASGVASLNAPGMKLYNENANNAHSVYSTGFTDGVLGWTPQTANVDVYSSGNFVLSSLPEQEYTTDMDVYATVKTTYSGTKFTVSLLFGALTGSNFEYISTQYKVIQNVPNPTIVYLGKVTTNNNIYGSKPQLKLRASAASGTLLIDSIVCHPVSDPVSSATIFFPRTKITPSYAASGVNRTFGINIYSNYIPMGDSSATPTRLTNPALIAYWADGGSTAPRGSYRLPYRGNIALFKRVDDITYFNRFIHTRTNGYWYGMILATGSTHNAINQWRLTLRNGTVPTFVWSYSKRLVLGTKFTVLEDGGVSL